MAKLSERHTKVTLMDKPPSPGIKSDAGKLEYHLLPTNAIRAVVKVLMYGVYDAPTPAGGKGYGEGNWQHVPEAKKRYYNAAMRHVTDWWDGEKNDKGSGLPHLAHAACDILFLLAMEEK